MRITDQVLDHVGGLIAEDNASLDLVIDGRYEVLARIARGGMGEVFRARDLRLGREVAMKILAAELSSPAWTARFEDEARTMGQVDHPGVVPIHDLGLLPDGRAYYTMKLVQGCTFDRFLKDEKGLRSRLRVLARTCAVVQHAHDRGIVHRDLKPRNLMVGDNEQVFVLDWGIARVRDEFRLAAAAPAAGTRPGVTSPGTILGTLEYMPPEQARGDSRAIDERSDVWALGAILYEILTGRPPTQGPRETELLLKAATGTVVPPRRRAPQTPADLEAVCMRALARNPGDRFPSARALAEDLRRWLEGDPVSARRPSLLYRAAKLARKRKGAALALAAAAAALVFLAGTWWAQRSQARVWALQAEARLRAGDLEEAKRLFDQARVRIAVDPALYRECEEKLAARRRAAEAKEVEDRVFGPIRARLRELPATPDGRRRALQLVDEGLSKFPDSWSAWALRAEILEKLGRDEEALASWKECLARNPGLGMAHYHRGRILIESLDRESEALAEFEAAQRVEPGNEFAILGRARTAGVLGRYRESLDLLAQVERLNPSLPDLHYARGVAYAHPGAGPGIHDLDKALESYSEALRLDPAHGSALLNRGALKFRRGDRDGAFADYSRAIDVRPDSPAAYANRGDVLTELGKLDAALADLDRAVQLGPGLARAWHFRARARARAGRLDEALSDYTKGLELSPGDAPLRHGRAIVRRERGDLKGSLEDYDRLVSVRPNSASDHAERGELRHQAGDLEGAIADFTRSLELNPKDPAVVYNRGNAREERGDVEGAIADYSRAIELDGSLSSPYLNRGYARRRRGDLEGALADYTKAIELDPKEAKAYSNRAAIHGERGRFDEAMADLDRAIEIKPDYASPYSNRSWLRMKEGDLVGALADGNRAVELAPRVAGSWNQRAVVRKAKKDFAGADADFSKAIELDPGLATAYANRGVLRADRGRKEEAIADLMKAIELTPEGSPRRREFEQALGRIRN